LAQLSIRIQLLSIVCTCVETKRQRKAARATADIQPSNKKIAPIVTTAAGSWSIGL
jgi:hypothetical protein